MIDLYYAATPNGHKVRLFLEEAGLAYRIVPVNLSKGEQHRREFLTISPNGRIPAIVDHAPSGRNRSVSVFESGAILFYLAEKSGMFLPAESGARLEVLQWLFWQMGGLGPMAGQIGHFNVFASENVPYAIERYRSETARLYDVLDRRLADRAYIAGDYSIADMACFPWIVPHAAHGQRLQDFTNLLRWFEAIRTRAAVVRTYGDGKDVYTGRPLQIPGRADQAIATPSVTQSDTDERTATMKDVTITYCRPCGYGKRAAEAADALQRDLSVNANLVSGKGGIFEVRVNGEVVAKRIKGHFPDAPEIVGAVSAALE